MRSGKSKILPLFIADRLGASRTCQGDCACRESARSGHPSSAKSAAKSELIARLNLNTGIQK
jgi:hypothetical protein